MNKEQKLIAENKKLIEDNAVLHKRLAKANETIRLLLQDADSGIDSPN